MLFGQTLIFTIIGEIKALSNRLEATFFFLIELQAKTFSKMVIIRII